MYYSGRFEERVNLFTWLSLSFLFKKKYLLSSSFWKKDFEYNKIDPSKEFSLLFGVILNARFSSLYGFSKIYILGIDYLCDNPKNGHLL